MSGLVAIVGSRSLPASSAPLVSRVVSRFVSCGYRVASGGAMGADSFALAALLRQGAAHRGVIFSAWPSVSGFPLSVRSQVSRLLSSGGSVVWGSCSAGSPRHAVVAALLARSRRMVSHSTAVVAFLHGPARGTLYTIRQAVSCRVPVVVFLCGGGASVPPDLASHCTVVQYKGGI